MDAYERIRRSIIEGEYEPGRRLTEETLAAELHLSRTPIREALKRLETEGLVIPLKRGVSVRTYSHEDIRQIYDLRALLEGYAAHQAAVFRPQKHVETLKEVQERYCMVIERGDFSAQGLKDVVQLNNAFHEAVISAANNDQIHFMISKVFVLPLVFRSFYWYDKREILQSMEFHHIILEAISAGEPYRAQSAMLEHIYKGRDHVLRHLSSRLSEEKKEENQ